MTETTEREPVRPNDNAVREMLERCEFRIYRELLVNCNRVPFSAPDLVRLYAVWWTPRRKSKAMEIGFRDKRLKVYYQTDWTPAVPNRIETLTREAQERCLADTLEPEPAD
jgi:hypothetical protein